MINISIDGSAIKFVFEGSSRYLYGDGVIQAPINSLALVIDKSDLITLVKASSNDPFVSFLVAESNFESKDAFVSWFKSNAVSSGGGGGGTVTIDPTLDSGSTNPVANSAITDAIDDLWDEKADKDDVYTKDEVDAGFSSVTSSITAAVSGKADTSAVTAINSSLTAHTANTDIHTTSAEKSVWSGKQDALTAGSGISINNNVISCTVSGGGNANIVEVTQAEYDSLVSGGTVDPDALYVITDAEEINLSGYAQSSAVTAEIAAAVSAKTDTSAFTAHTADTTIHTTSQEKSTWSGKQDALVSGTNIKTINGESILGSGNISISGGGSVTIDSTLDSGSTNPVANSAITNAIDNIETVTSAALNALDASKIDTSAITTSVTSASTDSQIPTAKAVYDAIPSGGTGGMDDDMEKLISSSLNDLNDRKIDASEVMTKYQRKGDYATNTALALKANSADVMTLAKSEENEFVAASALVDLNNKFGGLSLVKITESDYAALTTKDDNTLYIVVADPT